MFTPVSRRTFVQSVAGVGGSLAIGLPPLPAVSAAETAAASSAVRFADDIEPLVRLLETTERGKLIEVMAGRIKRGEAAYPQVVAAVLLAGIRNVQPRPAVGFKFHAVLVVNSAHLASVSSPPEDRWLPILWAIDAFKASQAADVREGDWTMAAVNESALPSADRAKAAFVDAMERWDEPAADVAAAALARTVKLGDAFDLFYRLGARDFRSIGHKAIYVANARRCLDVIGHGHAEPVLRSLAYALLQHEGGNPAERDGEPDRAGRRNAELAATIRDGWTDGKPDDGAALDLLKVVRTGSDADMSGAVVEMLNRGVSPASVWDGLFEGAGELLMRQPGIVALHAVTTTNALHYAFTAAKDDAARRYVLLQNAAFLPLFRGAMVERGKVGDPRIDQLAPQPAKGRDAIEEIFADVSRDRTRAAAKTLAYLEAGGDAQQFIDAARRLIFTKGTDAHDYKFSSAALEDYRHVSPRWRHRFLAASVFRMRGSGDKDNKLIDRVRAALA